MKANHSRKGYLFLFSGSTGVGKTTLVYSLLNSINEKYQNSIKFYPTFTTRGMRRGEINGIDYFFITEEEFLLKKKEDFFLETVKIDDIWYGTSKEALDLLRNGNNLIMIVNVDGIKFWKSIYDSVYAILISVSSFDLLDQRILNRDKNDIVSLNRVLNLKQNNADGKSFILYDYSVINDHKEIAELELYNFIFTIIKNKKNVDSQRFSKEIEKN